MIVSRSVIRAKRGHNNDVVAIIKEAIEISKDSQWASACKGYRIYSNYTGDNSVIIYEEEFETVADWDNAFRAAMDSGILLNQDDEWWSKYWDLLESWDRDFWIVEAQG